ncbi:MAG: L-proline dehydrogenase / delta-pyrroline-5-carboxylate dehydrogenase [Sphingomonas bacterium]|uniref:bifunctional proline dehydrogenase/L-glutamate gamma-semialdehyde dehydrogenase PutA n=1 Tax=Sphingomonas bacterium TaxID=1895847 RepID=UPI002601E657|nr:bifunctional proline dehydrogenase/L-glutamate gamma-semialdehyde dehydrogenase PutA [Sphingomonas bacterium]MDB5711427.1 L-proline dehydrogenase / delta-pyrroline-5-carboxylate dehydrogenase [Sphingomonas bacterium]
MQETKQMTAIDWDRLDEGKYRDESAVVRDLLARQPLSPAERETVVTRAATLVEGARATTEKQGIVESFLQQFSLGTREGLALMCLAEALLRTPDPETRDRLIAEKIGSAEWGTHLGQSDSMFVNASTWGLMLTGKLVDVDPEARSNPMGFVKRMAAKLGEPVIRQAVAAAVRIMGEQFVLGRTIEDALARSKREGYLCSFDMLGEGARTAEDAERYEHIYARAIDAVGEARGKGLAPEDGHGVSIKLSALSPRYEAVQEARVWEELYPRMKRLVLIAAGHDLNLAIDAEEADRLVLSLKLVDRLARDPELGDWKGLGVVVQAYQKRGLAVIAALETLAKDSGRRIMVRLVKGAYWDSEIKRAQIAGRPGYPVFTTKPATDLSYLVCAEALIAASPSLYPQFATHNAHTLAAVRLMAERRDVRIEHQRLHGMGEALYRAAGPGERGAVLRAYAPVGGHEDLLPYLVRRLLENGANTSFVHALLDEDVPAAMIVADPVAAVEAAPGPHPKIPLPADVYGSSRKNPLGRDYSIAAERARAAAATRAIAEEKLAAGPIIGGKMRAGATPHAMTSPSDHAIPLGMAGETSAADIDEAVRLAAAGQRDWDQRGGLGRAHVLRSMGDALERDMDRLIALLSREAGKTLNDGVAEVREAVDFCRYYAHLAEQQFAAPETLRGPVGETNQLELRGRGTFACISPWNFPLAIFTGQIAAALAAGNAVLAKPAEQTPFIAAAAVKLFHAAGLNPDLLALLPGDGATVGAALVVHPGVHGVAFTGGTDTARAINRQLADRPGPIVPFIAETGGLNGLFADSTALREQVVDDVIVSAIGSAGQRCSALRLLFLPKDTADTTIAALTGALDTLVIGDPADPGTDVGPVIDEEARALLDAHVERLEREAKILARRDIGGMREKGSFFGPVIAEVPSPDFLAREVFGPVLHIYRYDPQDLASVATALADRGYGLTLGVHSRIDRFAEEVRALVPAGNFYVNRSIVGAVVGVQPFGGEGLSGTGPKAGGPHALLRYAVERAISINITAQGGDPALLNL